MPVYHWRRRSFLFVGIEALLRLLDPGNGRVERRIFAREQSFSRERRFNIRCYAQAFERLAAFRKIICNGVLESVAVGEHFEDRWQRRRGGVRAKNSRSPEVLHPAGENL